MRITAGIITQERDIAADNGFINVPWQIEETSEDGTANILLMVGAQGFPLSATSDEIREFLERKLQTYKENAALHEGAKEAQAQVDNANVVAGEITGLQIGE